MNEMNFFNHSKDLDKEEILNRLEQFSREIGIRSEIIVIGASSLILGYNLDRKTEDIDILNTVQSLASSKYAIQVVNEGILFLMPDYKDRLNVIAEFRKVTVFSLGALDVALVKLGRGLDKDIDDVKMLFQKGLVSREDFKRYYPKFRDGYGGSYYVIDSSYHSVLGERYDSGNDRMFD
jgi:hypothetical protein